MLPCLGSWLRATRAQVVAPADGAVWAVLLVALGSLTVACSNYTVEQGGFVAYDGSGSNGGNPQFQTDAKSDAKPGSQAEVTTGPKDTAGEDGDPTASVDVSADDADDADGLEDGEDGSDETTGGVPDTGTQCSTQACGSDADCPAAPGACKATACLDGCCQVVDIPSGGACDDGDPCTEGDVCAADGTCAGQTKACEDGLTCTQDSCEAATGKCLHALQTGWCSIDGACVEDGGSPPTEPCKLCKAADSPDAWSGKPGCCTVDADCPKGGVCDLPACDAATGKCGLKKVLGCCETDKDCDDGNLCTIDTCDPTVGGCSSVPKQCPNPTACQKGLCNPNSGDCQAELKPGFCFIDGVCRSEGESAVDNACLTCKAAQGPDKWTPDVGAYCNDGDDCTFTDVCDGSGTCKGTAQKGCCKSDADCPATGDPCKQAKCNVAAGVCVTVQKTACCTAGVCCDPVSNTIKTSHSSCSDAILATEYQCSGSSVQKRETSPGCTGSSPDACLAGPDSNYVSAWTKVKDCPADTQCKASASGQMPTCEPIGPVGSCQGSCGGKTTNGTCWCDAVCSKAGDCCKDFMSLCGCTSGECCDVASSYPKASGTACGTAKTEFQCSGQDIQKRTSQPACDGKNNCGTGTFGAWTKVQTCASSETCTVAAGGTSASCKVKSTYSCVGKCGKQAAGLCWCDTACKEFGDCCKDFDAVGCAGVQSCGAKSATSCKGKCGGAGSGGCYCDSVCEQIGDCCADKALCGC